MSYDTSNFPFRIKYLNAFYLYNNQYLSLSIDGIKKYKLEYYSTYFMSVVKKVSIYEL